MSTEKCEGNAKTIMSCPIIVLIPFHIFQKYCASSLLEITDNGKYQALMCHLEHIFQVLETFYGYISVRILLIPASDVLVQPPAISGLMTWPSSLLTFVTGGVTKTGDACIRKPKKKEGNVFQLNGLSYAEITELILFVEPAKPRCQNLKNVHKNLICHHKSCTFAKKKKRALLLLKHQAASYICLGDPAMIPKQTHFLFTVFGAGRV